MKHTGLFGKVSFLILLIALVLPAATDIAKWRADYEASLKAPDGWLSVAGLVWLHEGPNTVGPAVLNLHGNKVTYQGRPLQSDISEHPDVVKVGNISITVIDRGGKLGARLRDPDAPTRREFTGCNWFRASASWDIKAKWVAYLVPKKIAITNILGMTDQEPSPGYAEFTIDGATVRLEPVTEDGELFFMFRDATSGKTTYGAGRFLYAAMPKSGTVDLDFNKAHNPPCAFTAFATCPLPPKQNVLKVAIDAGEKNYGKH